MWCEAQLISERAREENKLGNQCGPAEGAVDWQWSDAVVSCSYICECVGDMKNRWWNQSTTVYKATAVKAEPHLVGLSSANL